MKITCFFVYHLWNFSNFLKNLWGECQIIILCIVCDEFWNKSITKLLVLKIFVHTIIFFDNRRMRYCGIYNKNKHLFLIKGSGLNTCIWLTQHCKLNSTKSIVWIISFMHFHRDFHQYKPFWRFEGAVTLKKSLRVRFILRKPCGYDFCSYLRTQNNQPMRSAVL